MGQWERTTEANFQTRLEPEGECLIWPGGRAPGGYGRVSFNGRDVRAHRLALEFKLGRPLMPGMEACHTCDNPPCARASHLFEGTRQDNIDDRRAKGGYDLVAYRGERNPAAKLTCDQVDEMRRLASMGMGPRRLGPLYGISHQHASKIIRKLRWK